MMKHFLIALSVIVFASTAQAAGVGVSVSVGQPGFYSRIDIGGLPRPQTIYPRPVTILPPPGRVVAEPVYLYVPAGHARHWSRHCREYNACGRPVYFLHDRWYNDVYAARRHEGGTRHGRGPDRDHDGWDRGDGRGHGHGRY